MVMAVLHAFWHLCALLQILPAEDHIGHGSVKSSIGWYQKILTIVGKIKVVLYHEAKITLLFFNIEAQDGKGILGCLMLSYLHATIYWFARACHELGILDCPFKYSLSTGSILYVVSNGIIVMAIAWHVKS